jgi:DNA-directed RNA polymerase II subunit RPB2
MCEFYIFVKYAFGTLLTSQKVEMEKDSMIAHGIGQYLKERMMETSDISKATVCDKCGLFATKVMDKDYYVCNNCNNHTEFSTVSLPYAFKLLAQELTAVNILPRIRTEKVDL